MSAELIDLSPIPTIDSRVSEAEMEFAERGEGSLANRFKNARKMLEAFHRNGTPDEVVEELELTPEEFDTAIDDAQSLYDGLALHVIALREAPISKSMIVDTLEPMAGAEAISEESNGEMALTIIPEQDTVPGMTKQQLVDAFSQVDSHKDSTSFRESFERLLSLSKEGGTSRAAEAAKYLRGCLVQVVEHGSLDEGELPLQLFTGDVFSSEERRRLFMLIGISAERRGTGQRFARNIEPVVLNDIRKNARSGRNNPDEAEANALSALNTIANRLGLSANP